MSKNNLFLPAGALVIGGAAAGLAYFNFDRAMSGAEASWRQIARRSSRPPRPYDPAAISELPEIAQRYFRHAIVPGTMLRRTVELRMHGWFLLGEKPKLQRYAMLARQILSPPYEFVWIAQLRAGVMRIDGFDSCVDAQASTRFWLFGLAPVANARPTSDLGRSAQFRSAMEAIWVPAALLPEAGAHWQQIGPDQARIRWDAAPESPEIELTLAPDGAVRSITGLRWTNANKARKYQPQPFGGTIDGEATFEGFTIPSHVSVGNLFGTADYAPFFEDEITQARYL